MKCWGAKESSELVYYPRHDHLKPVDVAGLASGIAGISAGTNSTAALTAYGWDSKLGFQCRRAAGGRHKLRPSDPDRRAWARGLRPGHLPSRRADREEDHGALGRSERLQQDRRRPSLLGHGASRKDRDLPDPFQNNGDTLDQLFLEGSRGVQGRFAVATYKATTDVSRSVIEGRYWMQPAPAMRAAFRIPGPGENIRPAGITTGRALARTLGP